MGKVTTTINTTFLMRVGSTSTIQQCFDTKTITFGCAANWLDFALNTKNQTTGDTYECVFARLKKGDPRIDKITDVKGKPIGDHLLVLENEADDSCILRYIPTILQPIMCFYSFKANEIRKRFSYGDRLAPFFGFNLDTYRSNMEYTEDNASFLFIKDPVSFINDLKEAIPNSVTNNSGNLTSERFYGGFDPDYPLFCKDVDYDKHTHKEYFIDTPKSQEEMFWKMPEYRTQAELRITIPGINFINLYDPNKKYNYELNQLKVFLPKFHEYAMVISAKEAHSVYFDNFDDTLNTCSWTISNSTEKELGLKAINLYRKI